MQIWLIIILQWLHILGGIAWFGSYIFLDFVMWPAIWRLPASQSRILKEATFARATPLYGVIGPVVVLLGIVRGTVFGPVRSLDFLVGPAYGITWLVALMLGISLMLWGALWHSHGVGPVWEGDKVSPRAVRRIKSGFVFEMLTFGCVICCMVLMHFGF
jgi:uncharacterized membrane protein